MNTSRSLSPALVCAATTKNVLAGPFDDSFFVTIFSPYFILILLVVVVMVLLAKSMSRTDSKSIMLSLKVFGPLIVTFVIALMSVILVKCK